MYDIPQVYDKENYLVKILNEEDYEAMQEHVTNEELPCTVEVYEVLEDIRLEYGLQKPMNIDHGFALYLFLRKKVQKLLKRVVDGRDA